MEYQFYVTVYNKRMVQDTEYKMNYHKTFGLFPYLGKSISSFLFNISFLHKIIRNQFGGMFIFTYKKNVIPLTPQKYYLTKTTK